jgi:hypothetical protein
VSITVGIEARDGDHIFGLASLVHLATIMNGFSNDSYKHLKPVQMQQQSSQSKAYVEFTSNQFLHSHFVLVWTVARVDHARCAVEQLSPSIPGKPDTLALALTLVSNVQLNADEHGKPMTYGVEEVVDSNMYPQNTSSWSITAEVWRERGSKPPTKLCALCWTICRSGTGRHSIFTILTLQHGPSFPVAEASDSTPTT